MDTSGDGQETAWVDQLAIDELLTKYCLSASASGTGGESVYKWELDEGDESLTIACAPLY